MIQSKIAEIISEWTENALSLPFTIFCDLILDEDSDGACVRHDPTPAAEKRYADGSRLVAWNFTFYTRCKNAEYAREYGKRIVDTLDGATVESDGLKIDCEAVTLPQFIDTDAKGYTTYAESVKCTFLEE
jgi:hypothetical protein